MTQCKLKQLLTWIFGPDNDKLPVACEVKALGLSGVDPIFCWVETDDS